MPITPINVNNLGKMLKRAEFEYTIRRGTRLFSVIELTFDEVKSVQLGITSYENNNEQTPEKQPDSTPQNPRDDTKSPDPSLPF